LKKDELHTKKKEFPDTKKGEQKECADAHKCKKDINSSAGNRMGEHHMKLLLGAKDVLNPGLLRDREGF